MDDKVYTPEIIQETPFPKDVAEVLTQAQAPSGETYSPTKTTDRKFPLKRTAVELLSTALNTRSKKVLQEFELQQSGGFKVGDYQNGVSGDLRITPAGLTARNKAGLNTFVIDGETGDATFAGQIQSGSVITGEVTVGNNKLILSVDDEGEPQIALFNNAGLCRVFIGFLDL